MLSIREARRPARSSWFREWRIPIISASFTVAVSPDDLFAGDANKSLHGGVAPDEPVPSVQYSDRIGHRKNDLFPVHPADSHSTPVFFQQPLPIEAGNFLSCFS